MFDVNYSIDRTQVKRSVRQRIESDEMQDILTRKFKSQMLFIIATWLLTLSKKGYNKEELIELQKEFSNQGRELAKKTNTIDVYEALKQLEECADIKYDNKKDEFI